ncbi:MAG: hypothetical protein WCF90_10525 [Methanomicrobiales archaeon]
MSILVGFLPTNQGLTGPVMLVPRCSDELARIQEISEGIDHDTSRSVKEAVRADLRRQ